MILTQTAKESEYVAAMAEIQALDVSCSTPIRMRLEDFE
jgi:hypothetical protein